VSISMLTSTRSTVDLSIITSLVGVDLSAWSVLFAFLQSLCLLCCMPAISVPLERGSSIAGDVLRALCDTDESVITSIVSIFSPIGIRLKIYIYIYLIEPLNVSSLVGIDGT